MKWIVAGLGVLCLILAVAYKFFGYHGVVTAFTSIYGAGVTAYNILYHKNRKFYLFVNRLWFKMVRTHTLWNVSFRFSLGPAYDGDHSPILSRLAERFRDGKYGSASVEQVSRSLLNVVLQHHEPMGLNFSLGDDELYVGSDREMLVPAHLYERYQRRLKLVVDDIIAVVKPVHSRCGLTVSFGEGTRNPYYGLFVDRVPPDLLQQFQVTFRLDRDSDCRIEADTDRVEVQATNAVDLFQALSQVLNFEALPKGVSR